MKNSDALRAAVDDVQDDNTRLNNKFSQSKPLYRAFSQLRNATNLTEVQERILDGILLNAKVSGVDIQVGPLEVRHSAGGNTSHLHFMRYSAGGKAPHLHFIKTGFLA